MKLIRRLLGIVVVLAVVAGLGFWLRPVSYFTELMYVRATLSGVESRSVTVAGHRIHYNAEGPAGGMVVVLVHGLGGRAEDWRDLAPYLAKAGFRVYMPICPATGAARSLRTSHTRCRTRPRQWWASSTRWG